MFSPSWITIQLWRIAGRTAGATVHTHAANNQAEAIRRHDMAVRDSSAESKAINDAAGITESLGKRVLKAIGGKTMTRRMIAEKTGIETASVSSTVFALVESGELEELKEKAPCEITGRNVYWLRKTMGQLRLV